MQRELFERPYFVEGNVPNWRCPTCFIGALTLQGKLIVDNNAETRRYINEDYFEPDHVGTVFTGSLCCANCCDTVVFAGSGGMDREYDVEGDWKWAPYYAPRFFFPALKLIHMPENGNISEDLIRAIEASFSVFWINLDSCANRLRTAIELLLDAIGVERKVRPDATKELTLHQRIERIDAIQRPHIKGMLEAIKLVGNDGSHALDQVPCEDILTCYEILEHVLQLVYPPPSKTARMVEMAQKLVQKNSTAKNRVA